MKKLFFIFFLFISYGCSDGIEGTKLNEIDKIGKVIFHKEGELPLKWSLRNDFGLKVINDIGWFKETAHFYFISGEEKKEYKTTDLKKLFFLIKSYVPPGSTIDNYTTCTNGWHYKLDETILPRIARFCEDNGIIYYSGPENLLCTCGKNGP
ncbi:MAG: hypothetical protein GY714_00510 [Desulfobacterales bacterium]|nr:hypothetical protein [Desulfobacterales bacterium]